MKTTSIASVVALLSSAVTAHSSVHARHGGALAERQSGIVLTTGPAGTNVHPRLEIRTMSSKHPSQWTLLLLALSSWQNETQTNPDSYFGVTGIHGVPRQDYNGVQQCDSCQDTDGYAPHNSVLFPSWHRTFTALFEQELLARVNTVANSYNGSMKTTMQNAAAVMRWPYWDWAAHPPSGQTTLPYTVTEPTVSLTGPSGRVTIPNPLYSFPISDDGSLVYGPFVDYPRTYRYPTTNDGSAQSVNANATAAFDNIRQSLQDQVYQLFTTCTDYLHFSNDAAGDSSTGCSNSLEAIHNTIHGTAGGPGANGISGGHMTYLPLAAFDPLFFLHHANVDRLLAMWQAINPGSYGASQASPGRTWTIAQDSVQDANSNLEPFYKDNNNNFWTTTQVQSWNSSFRYTYPEFVNTTGDRAAIINIVNKLYGPSATATAGTSKRSAVPEPAAVADANATPAPVLSKRDPLTASNGSTYQYVANIQTPRYYLKGSYNVFLFNGAPASEDPSTWMHDEKLIGPMGVISHPGTDSDMKEVIVSGSVPLTRTLSNSVDLGGLDSLVEELVAPFLKANLAWRVAGPQGQCVDPATIPGFAVSVVSATATDPTDACELPVYSAWTTLVDVTEGMAGGLNSTTTLLGDAFQGLASAV